MKICQLTENLMAGDAISDHVLALNAALGELGWETRLYAANRLLRRPGAEAADASRMAAELMPEDVLLYQYSIGSPLTDWFLRQRCRKAIVYQNITPASFLQPYDAVLADAARLGREKLAAMVGQVDFSLASSAYNAAELTELGYENVDVLPLLLDFSRYEQTPDAAMTGKLRDGKRNILFVGRKAPNKCIEDVLLFADYYAAAVGEDCRLILAGDDSMEAYCRKLRALVPALSVELLWLGRVSQSVLNACYRESELFLCMSEHEGFCVPLLECMVFGVPVLAYAAAAVPETLGGSGICFTKKDFPRVAALMDALLRDKRLRAAVTAGEQARLEDFMPERIRARLGALLKRYTL